MVWLPPLELNYAMQSSKAVVTSWLQDTFLNILHFSASKESIRSFMEPTTLSGIPFVRAASHFPKRESVLAGCAPLSTWLTPTQPTGLLTVSTSSWKPSLIALDSLPVRAVTKVCSLLFPGDLVLSQHLHIHAITSDSSAFATEDRVSLQHLYNPHPLVVARLMYRN